MIPGSFIVAFLRKVGEFANPACHSERSEESTLISSKSAAESHWILRCAQNDKIENSCAWFQTQFHRDPQGAARAALADGEAGLGFGVVQAEADHFAAEVVARAGRGAAQKQSHAVPPGGAGLRRSAGRSCPFRGGVRRSRGARGSSTAAAR